MESPFIQIGFVFILATVLAGIVRLFKQPLIVAYILTGLILGGFGAARLASGETLDLLSKFGIAFLLFMVGLELKISDLKQIGKVAIIAGLGQIIFTFLTGFLVSRFLGFALLQGAYISIALTFSSTVIVVKLLSEKNDLSSLYGKVAIGILLVQDFVAILVLMFLSGFSSQIPQTFMPFLIIFLKGLGLFLFAYFLTRRIIFFIFQSVARSQELLFLTAVAWCFLFASLSQILGFSLEIGAFLAGVSLSSLPYHYQISSRVRPLRDLFITLFFVGMGMQLDLSKSINFAPILILSGFVLLGKPLVVLLLMSFSGFRKRTSFLTSISLAQISEFSLILAAMGFSLGHLSREDVTLITGVGIVTIIASSYLISQGHKIYQKLSSLLSLIERGSACEVRSKLDQDLEKHTILVGCNRTGGDILEFLKKKGEPYLVLDFNPEVTKALEEEGIPCLFGDVSDDEILNQLNLEKAKLIISTVPSIEDNLILVSYAKQKNPKLIVLVTASYPEEEEDLYKVGADYVVLLQYIGGAHVAHLLLDHGDHLGTYLAEKRKHE
ncbi:MAG: cation:proton antiporter [bacterium]|nr:cation:proton antiporter [bacterium]